MRWKFWYPKALVSRLFRHRQDARMPLRSEQEYGTSHGQLVACGRLTSEGPVAQRLEQGTHNPLVRGSNPCGPTNAFRSNPETWVTDRT